MSSGTSSVTEPTRVARVSAEPEPSGSARPAVDLTIVLEAGDVLGDLTFGRRVKNGVWPEPLVQRLRLAAEVFANALARKRSEDALRASELMKSAILGSLPSQVAVLDRTGRIIAANESWTRFARHGMARDADVGVGSCYLDVCRRAAACGADHAADALAGIQAVLDGSRAGFTLEYACGAPAERWIATTVVPLSRPDAGAVVSHTDVTERKRVEIDAQRSRQELSHFTRVSTMGELAASLAHELSQPLTGILTNAQAARRFLELQAPDLDELRSILSDIVDDDRRASEVIQRLRELLRKGEPTFAPVDLHRLIRDVVRLVSSDAIIRNVSLTLDLGVGSPIVRGDRDELLQVLQNLVQNAFKYGKKGGHVRIEAKHIPSLGRQASRYAIAVVDDGPGIAPEHLPRLTERFYRVDVASSREKGGTGLGLAIVKHILNRHRGELAIASKPGKGSTFTVMLSEARASQPERGAAAG